MVTNLAASYGDLIRTNVVRNVAATAMLAGVVHLQAYPMPSPEACDHDCSTAYHAICDGFAPFAWGVCWHISTFTYFGGEGGDCTCSGACSWFGIWCS